MNAAEREPEPQRNTQPAIQGLVMEDLRARGEAFMVPDISKRMVEGVKKYGTPLQPFNGRDAVMDCYQELLDAANYAKQKLYESQIGDPDAFAPEMDKQDGGVNANMIALWSEVYETLLAVASTVRRTME